MISTCWFKFKLVKIPFSLSISGIAYINSNNNVMTCFESIFFPLSNDNNSVHVYRLIIPIFLFSTFPFVRINLLVLLDHQKSKIYN